MFLVHMSGVSARRLTGPGIIQSFNTQMFGSKCWLSAAFLTVVVAWNIYTWPLHVAWTRSQHKG